MPNLRYIGLVVLEKKTIEYLLTDNEDEDADEDEDEDKDAGHSAIPIGYRFYEPVT